MLFHFFFFFSFSFEVLKAQRARHAAARMPDMTRRRGVCVCLFSYEYTHGIMQVRRCPPRSSRYHDFAVYGARLPLRLHTCHVHMNIIERAREVE